MGTGEAFLSYGYPLLLLAGSLSRVNVPSFIYLVCFAIATIWSPHPLLPRRKIVVSVVNWFLTIYSGLVCICHIVFHAVLGSQVNYGEKWLPTGSVAAVVLQYVGFQRIHDVGNGFRLITPDVVIFIASLTIVILLRMGKIFSREYIGYARAQIMSYIPRGPSTLNGLAIMAVMFLSGISYASGLQSVYFVIFQAIIVARAFLRLDLSQLLGIVYFPLFVYNILHVFVTYVTQARPIRTRIPLRLSDTLGLKYHDVDITPVPLMGVTICLAWASSIVLLILLAFRKRNSDLRALLGMDRSYLGSGDQSSRAVQHHPRHPLRETKFWRIFRKLVRGWGWRACVVALIAIALFLPSFFSVVLLFAACVACVVPQVHLEKYLIIPGITVYLLMITVAQYLYNIPHVGSICKPGQQSPTCAIGLRVYDYTWFQIGLQTLAGALLAMNWSYYSPIPLDLPSDSISSSDSSSRRRVHKQLDENLIGDEHGDAAEGLLLTDDDEDHRPRHRRTSVEYKRRSRSRSTGRARRRSITSKDSSWTGLEDEQRKSIDGESTDPSAPSKKKSASSSPGRCARFLEAMEAWWKNARPAMKTIGFWALKQSYLVCLCGVYVAGLNRVTLLNAVYLLILILFLTSPRIAREWWLFLVLYTQAVILTVYTWSATPWTANIDKPKLLAMIGLKSYPTTTDLFVHGLVWHLVIMLFAVLQLWVLRYTDSLTLRKTAESPNEAKREQKKIPRWMRAIGDGIFWLWDEYGLIAVYTVLVFVASRDGNISFINILYILLLFVCLTIHMITRRALVHIKRFWIFVVVASGVILIARYAYQFEFIQEILARVMPPEVIIALGFIHFPSGAVFAPLLGNTFVFLVAVIQLLTFFAKRDPVDTGYGHNAAARRLATDTDLETYETDHHFTDFSDNEHPGSRPSSLPGSFKMGRDGSMMYATDDDDQIQVPLHGVSFSQPPSAPGSLRDFSSLGYSQSKEKLLQERGSSAKAERDVSAAQHLLMDEDLVSEDIAKHPTSSLRARKRRLRRKHFLETFLYTRSLDVIYWLKRFFMLHAYKLAALILVSVAVHSPSGLNSVYVEVAILSVSADHLTDGVGLLVLLYTQISMLFMLVYQFSSVYDGLSAYQPLIAWAGFNYLPNNRFSLIATKLLIVIALLVQRFAHRWKNDWYRVNKIEIEHELEPPSSLNADMFYDELIARHHPYNPSGLEPTIVEPHLDRAKSPSPEAQAQYHIDGFALSRNEEETKYGILQQLKHLMQEDERDNEAIEKLKSQYLHKTELTLFLYDSSEHLVMENDFTWKEAWNLVAWFASNILLIGAYPVFVGALLVTLFVHKETVYGAIYLLLLGLTIITARARWSSNGFPVKAVTVYVAVVLLLQYILNLDLPPPDLKYPWADWDPRWLSWLGLKQVSPRSTILIADFVLLLVLARIRRISVPQIKQIHWSRYWYYLVGPVITNKENKTWRDSVRYVVYRFSPFVILNLIFIAGTIHPDLLSLIYVFFALLFIFRESTIYSQRNKIWRFARAYNFFLLFIIILYQIPAIKTEKLGPMSAASVIGLRKFADGGSIVFSIFIFILLGIQKRLFSRVEFDELVLSILDDEERGVRMAQERFQEWKAERRAEFQRVQEQKRQRKMQLDFLKAARQRQQKLWQRIASGGSGGQDGSGSKTNTTMHSDGGMPFGMQSSAKLDMAAMQQAQYQHQQGIPPGTPYAAPSYDYINDPRMRTMSTSHGLKMLQSTGGLSIEQDPNTQSVKLKFKPSASAMKLNVPSSLSTPTKKPDTTTPTSDEIASSSDAPVSDAPPKPSSLAAMGESKDDLSEFVVKPREGDDENGDDDDTDGVEEQAAHEKDSDDDEDDEEDVLASALSAKSKSSLDDDDDALEAPTCCRCIKTPMWLMNVTDMLIGWLDRHTDGYLSQKPHYSRKFKIWAGFYKLYQINSSALVYLFFLVNCAVNSDIISLFYPITMFLYALLETPRPHKLYWNTVFVYAAMTILIKFFYQLSIFCVCHTGNLHWALASTCAADPGCLALDKKSVGKGLAAVFRFSAPRVVGITSYSKKQGGTGGAFIVHIIPDLLILISVFMHRYWLKKLGYWNFVQRLTLSKEGSDEPMSQRQLNEEAKRFEAILLKQQKKREEWTRYAAEKKKRRFAKRMKALAESGGSPSQFIGSDMHISAEDEKYLENDSSIADADVEQGFARSKTSGLNIVSNPLFKVGESDLETDSEEMSVARSSDIGKRVKFGEDSFASALTPDTSKSPIPASGEGESILAPKSLSAILGASASEQVTKRRGSPKPLAASGSGTSDSDMEETIMIGKRAMDSSEESEEDGEESSSDSEDSSASSLDSDLYDVEEENLYADNSRLRRKRALNNAKRYMKSRWNDVSNFFQNVVANKPGRDYYVVLWFIELLCFFFIILMPGPFIGNSAGNVADFLTQSRLPNSYVLTLLVQFIFIVIERVLYLFRAIKIKVIYHSILVVFYHAWMFFIIPILTSADFSSQPKLIAFYLLKVLYLYVSSLQIMHGYPAFVQGQFLTDSQEPGMIRSLIYTAYRAIPFVYELRTLLDWTVTKTSLTFFEWLKLEDIYANLFLVKCRVSQDRVWKRNVGDPQAWYVKWGMGVLLFVGLSALIWFPLLILMQGSPSNQPNPIVAASISVGFTGFATPIFNAIATPANMHAHTELGTKLFNRLRVDQPTITYDDYQILQWIEFENFSDTSWAISPPAKQHLLDELINHPKETTMRVHLTFTRSFAISTGTGVDFDTIVTIANPMDIVKTINGSQGNFTLPSILPRYFRIPNNGDAVALTPERPLGTIFELGGTNEQLYWKCDGTKTTGPFPWDNSGRIQLVTFSAEAPTGLLRSLASVGLIGLYVGVVLAVARFLRMSITDLAFRIIYEDMPACEELISYCEDIYMARQDADLVLEEELFRELVEIYRSPETIIGRTIRTHPRFAGRELTEKEKRKLAKEDPQLLAEMERQHKKQD